MWQIKNLEPWTFTLWMCSYKSAATVWCYNLNNISPISMNFLGFFSFIREISDEGQESTDKGVGRCSKEPWVGIKPGLLHLALQYMVTCLNCELNHKYQRNVSSTCAIGTGNRQFWRQKGSPTQYKQNVPNKVSIECIDQCFLLCFLLISSGASDEVSFVIT